MSRPRKGGKPSFSRSGKPGFGKKENKGDKKSSGKFVRKDKSDFDADRKFKRKDDNRSDDKPRFKKDSSYAKASEDKYDRKPKWGDKEDKYKSGSRDSRKKFGSDDKPRFKKDSSYAKTSEDKYDRKPKWGDKEDKFKSGSRDSRKKFGSDDKPRFKKDSSYAKASEDKDDRKSTWGDKNDKYGKKKFERDDKPRFKKDSSYAKASEDKDERKSKWGNNDDKPRFKKDSSYAKASEDKDERKSKWGNKDDKQSKSTSDRGGWKKGKSAYDAYIGDEVDHEAKKKSFEKGKNEYNRLLKKSEKNLDKEGQGSGDGTVRLNRYIANSGVCSRREADNLILAGAVKVNGVVVTQLGTKVKPGDKVQYGDQTIKSEKHVYILLNKPKDYITTMDDPQGRKTVMSLIRGAAKERVYPVGRLDRNTTGVILFTNDGELTRRLTHPKFLVSKMYHVEVDQNFAREDLVKMREGFELEDGFIKPDQLEFTGESKRELGIEVHSGRNRIVRRMFEHFGYNVIKLDRVMFAGLNKKDIPRGKWRMLSEKEVGFLKML